MSLAVFHRLLRHSAAPFALALCLFAPVVSHAEGGAGVSGGDDCEQRFKEVANDVRKWVEGGGPKFLDHKKCGSTMEEYTRKMKAATSGFKVQCVSKKDPPDKNGKPVWPVQVNGSPKMCINWEENGTRQFRCDYSKFYKDRPTPTNDSGQYRLVHHEFAAIAGLEPASDNDSNYCYSDQLEGFLENKKVLQIGPKKDPNIDLKLSRLEKSQTAARRKYPDPHCLETIKTVKAFERDGKDPRVIIEEKSCQSESAVSYHAKVFTKDGDEIPEEGVALNPMGSAYKTDWTKRIPEAGLRLQRLFLRMNSGIPCIVVKVSPEGRLLETSDCKFSGHEAPKDEPPLDEGMAPAA